MLVRVISELGNPCNATIVRKRRGHVACADCRSAISAGDVAYCVNGFTLHYFCESCGKARQVQT